jgi:hypothetical protein
MTVAESLFATSKEGSSPPGLGPVAELRRAVLYEGTDRVADGFAVRREIPEEQRFHVVRAKRIAVEPTTGPALSPGSRKSGPPEFRVGARSCCVAQSARCPGRCAEQCSLAVPARRRGGNYGQLRLTGFAVTWARRPTRLPHTRGRLIIKSEPNPDCLTRRSRRVTS